MRFWIVGGGTAGHVYPALAIALALRDIDSDATLSWVGTLKGMEGDLVRRHNIPYIGLPGGGLHGVALLNAVRNGWDLARAVFVAGKALRSDGPAAVLTTGGFVGGPVAIAARWYGVPSLVFVPDIEPAQSVKAIARLAQKVAVSVPESLGYFQKGQGEVTGYPLGDRITGWTRDAGREALGLNPDELVFLVFGGSRGARSINRAVVANVVALTGLAHVVHISGTLDWPEVEASRAAMPEEVQSRYDAYPYLHEQMGGAMAAADLVLCRSGASVLGEFPHFGLPSILVPYPYAWRYQRVNAGWLEERGAAIVVEDAALGDTIVNTVARLIGDGAHLHQMAEAARKLAQPDAAARAARLLLALGQGQGAEPVTG
jgi:UDP-N-acetylglucosamine--N-acetylmuramyl-(pentapeptide) pyrophosphoryl-undecaprenol N-acetylglucosamine transferase